MTRRCWIVLLLCLLFTGCAQAMEMPEEDFDYWYEEMRVLVEDIGTREVGTPGEQTALTYLKSQWMDMGYSFEDGTLFTSSCTVPGWSEEESVSLIAIRPAVNPDPQIITVCAHYDSLAPGARDNASGAAAVLALSRIYSQREPFADTELRFILFSAEESGHQGSLTYCAGLTEDEVARSLAAFNVDIITLDIFEEDRAFSMDTLGRRTPDGYVGADASAPVSNRASDALLAAMEELGVFPTEEEEVYWCGPRTHGESDHESFHHYGIDSVNVCFRGTTASGGTWPQVMHSPDDLLMDLDLVRSWDALNALYTAVDRLADDPSYGR